ncbi:MAG: hypothetical protein PHW34_00165 [Hespellia sp.]|nr:hypothetical protein [Hespellia sp.]
MKRLIIDGNAVYEIDESCMRRKRNRKESSVNQKNQGKKKQSQEKAE